jgi:hypothetical protein
VHRGDQPSDHRGDGQEGEDGRDIEWVLDPERMDRWGEVICQTTNSDERSDGRRQEAALERQQNDGRQIKTCSRRQIEPESKADERERRDNKATCQTLSC